MKESKEQAFKRVAGKRAQRILKQLELLGNCGNKHNYEYTEEQVAKLFRNIDAQLQEARNHFNIHRSKGFQL